MGLTLESVQGLCPRPDGFSVTMDYLPTLSVNHYKYAGGIHTRPEVTKWMEDLATIAHVEYKRWLLASGSKVPELPLTIQMEGGFKDKRSAPDLHNLHKVVGDALQNGLGINDREMGFVDGKVLLGEDHPWVRISVILGKEGYGS